MLSSYCVYHLQFLVFTGDMALARTAFHFVDFRLKCTRRRRGRIVSSSRRMCGDVSMLIKRFAMLQQ